MQTILEIENVTKDFNAPLSFRQLLKLNFSHQKSVRALVDVSLSLKKGEILGILGPNGAGKTTILKVIATLILPNKGKVIVNGSSQEEKIKSDVGLLLDEERSFYWRLSGRENLEFFSALYELNKKSSRQRIDELLRLFSVDYADKRFDAYSTGMKKNFALIRALLHNPELLLLDEPTKSLDYTSSLNLRKLIKEDLVGKLGKSVVFTTHHMDEALDFADLFLILHKGKVHAAGTLEELQKEAKQPGASLGEIFVKLTS